MSKRFKQQDNKFYKKIGTKWRKAKGHQSKMRKKKKGAGDMPNVGYRTAKNLRYTINGKKVIYISDINALKILEKGTIIKLSSSFGKKKLLLIENIAKETGLEIFNKKRIKTANKFSDKLKEKKEVEKKQTKSKEVKKENQEPKIENKEIKNENKEITKKEEKK